MENEKNKQWQLSDFVGRKLRVVKPGEFITQEILPGRVTIYLDAEHQIERIKIDPELDQI